MNPEERFYCADCQRPVEYLVELDAYSCGGCEGIQLRDELVTERDLLRADRPLDKPREVANGQR